MESNCLWCSRLGAMGNAKGRAIVALDSVGAGVGETVYWCRGKEASFPFLPVEVPTEATIVGIVDEVNFADAAKSEKE